MIDLQPPYWEDQEISERLRALHRSLMTASRLARLASIRAAVIGRPEVAADLELEAHKLTQMAQDWKVPSPDQ